MYRLRSRRRLPPPGGLPPPLPLPLLLLLLGPPKWRRRDSGGVPAGCRSTLPPQPPDLSGERGYGLTGFGNERKA